MTDDLNPMPDPNPSPGGANRDPGPALARGRPGPVGALVAAAGAAGSVGLALALGLPGRDAVILVAVAGTSAGAAGGFGALALTRWRHRSVAAQATVVALTAVAAVGAGVVMAARAMFISAHDLRALVVVMAAAATVAVMVALVLGWRVGATSHQLAALLRGLDLDGGHDRHEHGPPPARLGPAASSDLSRVAEELAATRERLAQSRAREQALEASRRELVGWVSHDLRTPLAGIRAMVEALDDDLVTDAETVDRYHRTIRGEAERLADLVDDLFELSRINSGTLRMTLERVAFADIVSDALAGASAAAAAKGVHLQGRMSDNGPVELATPEVLRVVRNLLDNAIRHTPPDGTVVVEASVRDGLATLVVADACGGIPDTDLDRVFDLAFRGDDARRPDGGGGFGLAIARGIVEAHRGRIEVENGGPGCRFVVELPARQPA